MEGKTVANQILQESNNVSDKSEENQIDVQEKNMVILCN